MTASPAGLMRTMSNDGGSIGVTVLTGSGDAGAADFSGCVTGDVAGANFGSALVAGVRAANGTEALEKVRQGAPDLVVLDVMMEHLSEGFDVARTLRSDSQTKGIPIIMLTGVDQVYDMTMEAGRGWVPYDRYLEKPVSPENLVAQVKDMIG